MSARATHVERPGQSEQTPLTVWHELSVACLLIMEVCFLLPWLRSFWPEAQRPTTITLLALLLGNALAAYWVGRMLRRTNLAPLLRNIMLLALLTLGLLVGLQFVVYAYSGLGVGAMLLSVVRRLSVLFDEGFSPDFLLIIGVLYGWWRGMAASGNRPVRPDRTGLKLRLGLLALALFALLHRGQDVSMLLEVLPIFFGAGLLALVVGRADFLAHFRSSEGLPFNAGWLLSMFVIVAITLGAGLLGGALLQLSGAATVFGIVALLTLIAGFLPVAPIILLLFIIGAVVMDRLLTGRQEPVWTPEPVDPDQEFMFLGKWQGEIQQRAVVVLEWLKQHTGLLAVILSVLVIGLLVWIILRAGRRRALQRRELVGEEVQTLLSGRKLMADLRRRFLQARANLGLERPLQALRRAISASAVRRIYMRLMELAQGLGAAREESETPLEYLLRLQQIFPEHKTDVAVLTLAYNKVRYGEYPDEQVDMASVRQSWARLREAARQVRHVMVKQGDELLPPA
jgi:hypothetical protein